LPLREKVREREEREIREHFASTKEYMSGECPADNQLRFLFLIVVTYLTS
jgi:hypothetical protein